MAKNITIAEDGVSRNFTAKKLKTNLQGGGNCTWIPEDEAADYCTFKELKVTANGTYKASDKNCDGFDKVKVEISADVLPQKTITTNGEYDAMQDDGRVGYAHVTVNVPGGGGGPFTVLFLDDEGNVLKKQENVPYGGYASCTALDGTILNGLYFKGWNPVPKNVQFNMTCRPVRGDYQIISGEILDDWKTIVADGGAHYPLGSYKSLIFTIPACSIHHEVKNVYKYSGGTGTYVDAERDFTVTDLNFAMHVVKVAEGEDGSTSSWLSDAPLNFQNGIYVGQYGNYRASDNTNIRAEFGWADCIERKYLNENMLDALPLPLKNAIVPVNKTYKATNKSPSSGYASSAGAQKVDKECIDSIWVPSMKELHTRISTMSNYADYVSFEELSGIDYTTIFPDPFGSLNDLNMIRTACWGSRINAMAKDFNTNSLYMGGDTYSLRYALFGFCL